VVGGVGVGAGGGGGGAGGGDGGGGGDPPHIATGPLYSYDSSSITFMSLSKTIFEYIFIGLLFARVLLYNHFRACVII